VRGETTVKDGNIVEKRKKDHADITKATTIIAAIHLASSAFRQLRCGCGSLQAKIN